MTKHNAKIEWRDVAVGDVKVGDWADHVHRGLDPREVGWVSADGWSISLNIGTQETGPLPVENYTYRRPVEVTL